MADGGDSGGLGVGVTRRDFVNATLVGAGAALVGSGCTRSVQVPVSKWTGYGGVGDYAGSNGNTAGVVEAAHRIRDQMYEGKLTGVADPGEQYDLVIVGGGFGGLGAMLEFVRTHPGGSCLLIDNQEVFGGYAKANEFDVDGYRVAGSQASLNFVLPETDEERKRSFWRELGLPDSFRFAERSGGDPAIAFQKSVTGALYHGEQSATVGYRFGDKWVKDIWDGDLARAPWPDAVKQSFLTLREIKRRGKPTGAEAARLDAMTFADYARELKLDPAVLPYVSLGMCQTGPQVSALAAMSLPGIDRYAAGGKDAALADRFIAFPGGNTNIARHFVKALIPEAIAGAREFEAISTGALDLAALDRTGAARRIRLNALAVRVELEGDAASAQGVRVTYAQGGRLRAVRARSVVMATGSWVTKHVVVGLPEVQKAAFDRFLYAPMLVVNVALRNWRFLDKLGFSAARWFDGFGFYGAIRQPMAIGDRAPPFSPDKPTVLTIYVPFQNPDLPLEAQGPAGRQQMFDTPYADYEKQVVAQLTQLFAAGGFDAKRDIAGIVLNRWGHAFVTPGPGFLLGGADGPSPIEVARRPFGRIAFGQSGLEDWSGAARAGQRAVGELAGCMTA